MPRRRARLSRRDVTLFSTNENAAFLRISRSVFAEVKELSFSQPRRVGISSTREEETFRAAQVSARCGGDGASRVRGRAGGIDLRRCLQQRVGVLLCVPARPRRVLPRVFSSSVKQERARSPSADSRSAPLLSPSAPAFQMTRYYRYGELDTCDGRWAAIWACMDRSKRYVRLDRRRNISTARLVRVRSQNSTRTKKLTPSRFPRLTQGRPGAEREGTGARAGGS